MCASCDHFLRFYLSTCTRVHPYTSDVNGNLRKAESSEDEALFDRTEEAHLGWINDLQEQERGA